MYKVLRKKKQVWNLIRFYKFNCFSDLWEQHKTFHSLLETLSETFLFALFLPPNFLEYFHNYVLLLWSFQHFIKESCASNNSELMGVWSDSYIHNLHKIINSKANLFYLISIITIKKFPYFLNDCVLDVPHSLKKITFLILHYILSFFKSRWCSANWAFKAINSRIILVLLPQTSSHQIEA